MTAVDRAELKRVAEMMVDNYCEGDQRHNTGKRILALIADNEAKDAEIEGLKAERDYLLADRAEVIKEREQAGVWMEQAQARAAEAERQLDALRTRAPDSWRPEAELPDEIDLFRIIRRAGRSNADKAKAVSAHLAALRPQTAESGT